MIRKENATSKEKIMLEESPFSYDCSVFFPAIGITGTALPRTEKHRSKLAGHFTATEDWSSGDSICAATR
jgi:hypothetical protein